MFATALGLAVTLVACDRKPPTAPTTTTPTTPAGPATITRLDLTGPATVSLGQTAQYTAIAQQSDGTTRDVTGVASWSSSNSTLLSLMTPGQFTGRAKGQTSIRVSMGGRTSTIGEIIIVPEGTFRISGTVRDAGTIVDADVRIEDDALGRTDVRTSVGRYVVFGVGGNTRVTVVKSGYDAAVKIQMVASHQTIDFDLATSRPRADLSGRYTLTIMAAPECRLTTELASRSYAATVSQSGTAITVTLDGPQFVSSGGRTLNRFSGFLEAEQAIFRLTSALDSYYYYYFTLPDVLEVLGANSFYAFDGRAVAALGAGTLSGPLSGLIGSFNGPPYKVSLSCRSTNHRLVLTKGTT